MVLGALNSPVYASRVCCGFFLPRRTRSGLCLCVWWCLASLCVFTCVCVCERVCVSGRSLCVSWIVVMVPLQVLVFWVVFRVHVYVGVIVGWCVLG